MRLIDRPDVSDLVIDRTALPDDDGRSEPTVGAPRASVDVAEPIRLDPTRGELGPMPRPGKRRLVGGPISSLLLHLLPLLAILDWPHPPAEIPRPIPIKLVIEQPPPPAPTPAPPPPPAQPAPKRPETPPKGSYASDEFAAVAGPKIEPGRIDQAPEVREPQPKAAEAEAKLVAPPLPPPLPPVSLPELSATDSLAAATEPRNEAVAHLVLPPEPDPPKEPAKTRTPRSREAEWPLPLQQDRSKKVHAALLRGPDAIRDEYCAQALNLTMRQIGLLPRSVIGERQGETVLSIHVLGDGTINGVRVAHSSGYPDIDHRIEAMVVAVGRYPPLPSWMGPSMDFTFQMHFPNRWQR